MSRNDNSDDLSECGQLSVWPGGGGGVCMCVFCVGVGWE